MKHFSKDPQTLLTENKEKEYERLFRNHFGSLCLFAGKFLRSNEEKKDVVQKAFLKLWLLWENIEKGDAIPGWLKITVRNGCLDYLKECRNEEEDKSELASFLEISDNDPHLKDAMVRRVQKELKNLPDWMQQFWELSFTKGLKSKEIAERLNISRNTAYVYKSKVRKAIKAQFKKGWDPDSEDFTSY